MKNFMLNNSKIDKVSYLLIEQLETTENQVTSLEVWVQPLIISRNLRQVTFLIMLPKNQIKWES